MSSSEQKISSLRIASSPIVRDAYKKAASAGFMLLIIAFAFMMAVSALLNGVTAGGITQAVAPAILLTLLLYAAVPSVAISIATILLMPSSLKGNYSKIAHSLSLLMRCLDRLPLYRSGYRSVLAGEIARAQLLHGDFAGAEETYVNILSQFPPTVPQLGNGQSSARIASLFVGPALFSLFAGVACAKQNKITQTELHFERAREIFSICPLIDAKYGGILDMYVAGWALKMDELERAEASLNAACAFLNQDKILTGYTKLDRDRICSFVHVLAAIFYLRKGRTAEAEVEAMKYINFQKMHPGNRMAIEWLNMLGREYLLVSEYVKAELVLETAYWIGMQAPMHPDCVDRDARQASPLRAGKDSAGRRSRPLPFVQLSVAFAAARYIGEGLRWERRHNFPRNSCATIKLRPRDFYGCSHSFSCE